MQGGGPGGAGLSQRPQASWTLSVRWWTCPVQGPGLALDQPGLICLYVVLDSMCCSKSWVPASRNLRNRYLFSNSWSLSGIDMWLTPWAAKTSFSAATKSRQDPWCRSSHCRTHTVRSCSAKKSKPKRGLEMAAITKLCEKWVPFNENPMFMKPKVGMVWPFAGWILLSYLTYYLFW